MQQLLEQPRVHARLDLVVREEDSEAPSDGPLDRRDGVWIMGLLLRGTAAVAPQHYPVQHDSAHGSSHGNGRNAAAASASVVTAAASVQLRKMIWTSLLSWQLANLILNDRNDNNNDGGTEYISHKNGMDSNGAADAAVHADAEAAMDAAAALAADAVTAAKNR